MLGILFCDPTVEDSTTPLLTPCAAPKTVGKGAQATSMG